MCSVKVFLPLVVNSEVTDWAGSGLPTATLMRLRLGRVVVWESFTQSLRTLSPEALLRQHARSDVRVCVLGKASSNLSVKSFETALTIRARCFCDSKPKHGLWYMPAAEWMRIVSDLGRPGTPWRSLMILWRPT